MTDRFTKADRSKLMSSIKNKNTGPELNVRKALFAKGLRYRLHDKKLPGSPDLTFPKYKAVIFIHGCFWHNHKCKHGKLPLSNRNFWRQKLEANALRDKRNVKQLKALGWRVKIIWSCTLQNKMKFNSERCVDEIVKWVRNQI